MAHRFSIRFRMAGIASILAALAALTYMTPQASAQSSCGANITPSAACALPSANTTFTGSLQSDEEVDYYSVDLPAHELIQGTITDNEPTSCLTTTDTVGNIPNICGDVWASVFANPAQANSVIAVSPFSKPQVQNGVGIAGQPTAFVTTTTTAGTYYIEVSGNLSEFFDNNYNDWSNPTPYTVTISAQSAAKPIVTKKKVTKKKVVKKHKKVTKKKATKKHKK